jgi:hypothetical protein
MIGSPLQKCKTSEIHYEARVSGVLSSRLRRILVESSYLLLNVIERIGRVDSEANENDVRVGV